MSADNNDNDINLRTLRRVDATIVNIITSATQVAVYKFNNGRNEWERKEIEGSLFVFCKKSAPKYGFLVINRLSTTNMVEPVTQNLDFKLEEPYLLYKNNNGDIFCIWFYDKADCRKVGSSLQGLVANSNQRPQSTTDVGLQLKLAQLGLSSSTGNHHMNTKPESKPVGNNGQNSAPGHELLKKIFSGQPQQQQQQQAGGDITNPDPNKISILQRDSGLAANSSNGSHSSSTPAAASKQRSVKVQDLFNVAQNQNHGQSNNKSAESSQNQVRIKKRGVSESDEVYSSSGFRFRKEDLEKEFGSKSPQDKEKAKKSPPILVSKPQTDLRPTPTQVSTVAFGKQMYLPTVETGFKPNNPPAPEPNQISREQLKQSLVYLIQNDADFLHSIYEAYTNSLRSHK